jgi:hypothetical protein
MPAKIIGLLGAVLCCSSVSAQTLSKSDCASLAQKAISGAAQMEGLKASLAQVDWGPALARAPNGDVRAAMGKAAEATKLLAEALAAWVSAEKEMGYQLQRCSQ